MIGRKLTIKLMAGTFAAAMLTSGIALASASYSADGAMTASAHSPRFKYRPASIDSAQTTVDGAIKKRAFSPRFKYRR